MGQVAVGQRDAGVGGATGGCGDARHHLERDAGGGQFLDFFAAASEYERVAALQAQYAFSLLRQLYHHLVKLGLWYRVDVALFADVDALRLLPGKFHDGR